MTSTATLTPSLIPVIPESAPFSPSQRAWLNGFLAGLLNLQSGGAPAGGINGNSNGNGHALGGAPGGSALAEAPAPTDSEDDTPWHDPALAMDERLALADGRPHARRLMAAMAQLDCGACGYVCKTYAEAIAAGEEKDLSRCSPGGRETSKKLKELVAKEAASPTVQVAVRGIAVAPAAPSSPASPASAAPGGTVTYGRHNPFPAKLLACEPLNKPGSMKDTRFVALDLKDSGLTYKAGDALGIFPENDADLVAWVLDALDATGAEEVLAPDGPKVSLYDALHKHYSLGKPTDLMFELLINSATDPAEAGALKEILTNDACPEGDEVLDLLKRFPSARPTPEAFVSALNPLQPRLYSISSSPKAHPDEVHLTVGVVRYLNSRGRP
jgi:sulfite reductase (NADPH) flavoprotein alpha-component